MLIEYDRPVPPEWRARLAAITPPGQNVSWLELVWESGDEIHGPVGRWVLYEVTPPSAVPWWKKDLLLEEAPRSAGHRRILDYYMASGGALMQPFWVIQGDKGGHKFTFSDSERALLELEGLPTEPPEPGSLSYAPFDERVLRQVMRWDRLRKGYANLKSAHAGLDRDAEREFRRQLVAFLSEQVAAAIEEVRPVIDSNVIPVDDQAPEIDFDAVDETFVDTGILKTGPTT